MKDKGMIGAIFVVRQMQEKQPFPVTENFFVFSPSGHIFLVDYVSTCINMNNYLRFRIIL